MFTLCASRYRFKNHPYSAIEMKWKPTRFFWLLISALTKDRTKVTHLEVLPSSTLVSNSMFALYASRYGFGYHSHYSDVMLAYTISNGTLDFDSDPDWKSNKGLSIIFDSTATKLCTGVSSHWSWQIRVASCYILSIFTDQRHDCTVGFNHLLLVHSVPFKCIRALCCILF